jgi:hypothetical protein
MDNKSLEKRLEIWKRILFIDIGAAFTLFATGIADLPNMGPNKPYFPGWYGVWFVILLASLFPGFILLIGKHWMQLPLQSRLKTIFGYFSITWVMFFSIWVRAGRNTSTEFIYFLVGTALAIALGYWWLRRRSLKSRGDIFP